MKSKHLLYAIPMLAIGIASCSDEDIKPVIKPGEVVKTEFTIALNGKKFGTRQSQDVVQGQQTPTFRGIQDVYLIPFNITGPSVPENANRLGGENITLPQANAVPTINGANTITSLNENTSSQLYKDVAIPIGTNAFLFYGEASHGSYDNFQRGVLVSEGLEDGSPANIKFDLQPIYPDGQVTTTAQYLVNYLTAIANTDGWSSLDNSDPLKNLHTQFIAMHAGASANVLALVQDLYTTLSSNTSDMSTAIKNTITSFKYNGSDNAVTNVADGTLTFAPALQGWPSTEKNLPDGAAYVDWQTDKFVVITDKDNGVMNNPALREYAYPASLYYRANTPLKVHTSSLADKYTSSANWDELLGQYTGGDIVGLTTRSIILKNQIEYAVARLDVKAQANASTLNDAKPESFSLTNETFPITGVLVGGQRTVDYSFMPLTSGVLKEFTIYDQDMPTNWALTANSGTTINHTLVLTSHGEGDEGKVRVALELQNNSGKDFNGFGGALIPAGCKFYLVGELNARTNEDIKDKNNQVIKRVFLQDYITTATFTVKSLKNAYNVVPDLRLPALELGLGVNLNWTPGLNLDVNIE